MKRIALVIFASFVFHLASFAQGVPITGQITDQQTGKPVPGVSIFTGHITKALRYERQIELVFENNRWYDIRRWKILDIALANAKGVD